MSESTPPPDSVEGWYPDPQQQGLERYWDGSQWTPGTRPATTIPAPANAGGGRGCLVVVGIVVGLVILISVLGSLDDDEDGSDGGDSYTAEYMCEEFVKDRLKSPSTADFSGGDVTGVGPTYTVVGNVDSENSFGAMIRNSYECTVRHVGGDEWRLVDLQVSGN